MEREFTVTVRSRISLCPMQQKHLKGISSLLCVIMAMSWLSECMKRNWNGSTKRPEKWVYSLHPKYIEKLSATLFASETSCGWVRRMAFMWLMRNTTVCNIFLPMPEGSMGLEMLSSIRFIVIVKGEPGSVRNLEEPAICLYVRSIFRFIFRERPVQSADDASVNWRKEKTEWCGLVHRMAVFATGIREHRLSLKFPSRLTVRMY